MGSPKGLKDYQPYFKSLYDTARERLGFEPHPTIVLLKNKQNAENPLGKTAFYDPSEHKIAVYSHGRHIKDVLRSLSHELVHHAQNCRGEFAGGAATVEGYAQEDEHLRELEREAYEVGNLIFRDWEDGLKSKGGAPLFTSTHYTPPYTSDMVGGRLLEENKMKNKITESRLREIIKGVIEEMFNGDLDESLVDTNPAAFSEDAAKVELAQAASAAAGQGKDVDSALTTANENKDLEESVEEVDEAAMGQYRDAVGTSAQDSTECKKKEEMYNQSMELMYKEGPQSQSGDAAMKIAADAREADCNWTKPKLGEGINEEAEEEINEAADEKDDKEAKKDDKEAEKEVNEQVEDEINEEVEEELNESFVTDRNTLRRKQREELNKRLTKLWSK
jgi:hypothetical protein